MSKYVYDELAVRYEKLFTGEEYQSENFELMDMIGTLQGSVLDVGCGSGLLLDYMKIENYLGIDPSIKMLEILKGKHSTARTMNCTLEEYGGGGWNNVVCLFAGHYLKEPIELLKCWNYSGTLFAMFFKGDVYHTSDMLDVETPLTKYSFKQLKATFGVDPISWNDYLIVKL